jgi:prepilin-type N-terminal cleavage/methylation domain-containing protein
MTIHSRDAGFSLVELLIVLAIIVVMAAVGLPHLKAYSVEAQLVGATRIFQGEFRLARSIAARSGEQTAIRFEERNGQMETSTYIDGNRNGVLAKDIASGVDRRVSGPILLAGRTTGVRVAINPGTPAIPPERGTLPTADPIRFGNSNMVSFSPLGTASPGTFYIAGETLQGAVRVVPGSARVRLLLCRGQRWVEK